MTYFVTLDDKKECVGVFSDGELHFHSLPSNLHYTWYPSTSLASLGATNVEFGYFYANGKSLTEVCPPHLQQDWTALNKRMDAYLRSFRIAKVDLNDNCIFDLVPHQYLLRYCDLETQIIKHVFKTQEKPQNYDFMRLLGEMLLEMGNQKIKLNLAFLKGKMHNQRARDFIRDLEKGKKDDYVSYDAFKTKTGRLSVKKGSFPILNLDKDFRRIVEPTHDWILELDYNAAELRTLLALAGKEQPDEDIHRWNSGILGVSRSEAKNSVISWLYGSKTSDIGEELSRLYAKEKVLNDFYDVESGVVTTPFKRKLQADPHHALNYLVQSTTADLVFDRMLAIREHLKDKKSFLKFCLHDAVVIDLDHEERGEIKDILKIFSDTKLGKFRASVSAGRNFGDLKDFNI